MDREKVIKALEICTKDIPMSNAVHKSDFCKECPYYNAENRYCWNQIVMMRDALALLKEQESATEFIFDVSAICKTCGFRPFVEYAPNLELMKKRGYKYCPGCGRSVKWND